MATTRGADGGQALARPVHVRRQEAGLDRPDQGQRPVDKQGGAHGAQDDGTEGGVPPGGGGTAHGQGRQHRHGPGQAAQPGRPGQRRRRPPKPETDGGGPGHHRGGEPGRRVPQRRHRPGGTGHHQGPVDPRGQPPAAGEAYGRPGQVVLALGHPQPAQTTEDQGRRTEAQPERVHQGGAQGPAGAWWRTTAARTSAATAAVMR